MIRCVRIVSDSQGGSRIEEGVVALESAGDVNSRSAIISAKSISFHETPPHSGSPAHNAPTRQIVLTLSGTLTVRTARGQETVMYPGDVLLAEDVGGSGHSWHLVDDQPWRRAYIVTDDADLIFRAADPAPA